MGHSGSKYWQLYEAQHSREGRSVVQLLSVFWNHFIIKTSLRQVYEYKYKSDQVDQIKTNLALIKAIDHIFVYCRNSRGPRALMGLIYFSRFVIGSERVHAILLKYPNLFSSYLLTTQLIHISSVQHQVSLNNALGIAVPIMYTSPTTNKAVRLNVRLFMICFSNFQMKLQKARFSIGQN